MKQEKIVCAAIKTTWLDSKNERDAIFLGIDYKKIQGDEFYELLYDKETILKERRGFITNRNRFVDQKEAADIALDNNQVGEVNKLWDLFASKKSEAERNKMQDFIYNKTSAIISRGLKPEDLY